MEPIDIANVWEKLTKEHWVYSDPKEWEIVDFDFSSLYSSIDLTREPEEEKIPTLNEARLKEIKL